MRPIKFRAWDADDKVMRSWEEIDFSKDIGDDYYMVGYKANPAVVQYDHKQIIMQYTGLKDKNGVEIYEGDIVNRAHLFDGGYGKTHTGEVVYDTDYARYVISSPNKHINVYENPELLEREQK